MSARLRPASSARAGRGGQAPGAGGGGVVGSDMNEAFIQEPERPGASLKDAGTQKRAPEAAHGAPMGCVDPAYHPF